MQAALQRDPAALWRLCSTAMDQAFVARLQPQAISLYGVEAFSGHGHTRICRTKMAPRDPGLLAEIKVADLHSSRRGEAARKLARAARALCLQFLPLALARTWRQGGGPCRQLSHLRRAE